MLLPPLVCREIICFGDCELVAILGLSIGIVKSNEKLREVILSSERAEQKNKENKAIAHTPPQQVLAHSAMLGFHFDFLNL